MSSRRDRAESPRVPPPRRRTGSRMHPGWSCFFSAWLCGLLTGLTMIGFILRPGWHLAWYAAVALALFWLGGSKAEKLTDRP